MTGKVQDDRACLGMILSRSAQNLEAQLVMQMSCLAWKAGHLYKVLVINLLCRTLVALFIQKDLLDLILELCLAA